MNSELVQYFRCPEQYLRFAVRDPLTSTSGYFRVADNVTCYGSYFGRKPAEHPNEVLFDALHDIVSENGTIYLPFSPSQVADNLQSEKYVSDWRGTESISFLASLYYLIRPLLSVRVRRLLQKLYLSGWEDLPFPRWPVDCSLDNLFQHLLLLSLKTKGVDRIPFIWFWPEGASSCTIMTHDVESTLGQGFCTRLMDIDDSFGIKASFQIIPEERYMVTQDFLASIRGRGFEVAVHDLNHDGHLYRNKDQFLERAAKINSYGQKYNTGGFRAGVLYRKQLWYEALKFSYDMSVPNVARLDPQRGGCCTVMPYFLGEILELPVTTIQDYTLFYILNNYSIDLWKQQAEIIMQNHGLLSFIVHPDYIVQSREQGIYKELLGFLASLKQDKCVWTTTPNEVNRWWRQRAEMKLVETDGVWQIEGPGKERARIAYASEENGRLLFRVQNYSTGLPTHNEPSRLIKPKIVS
jgi:hypothetical protein